MNLLDSLTKEAILNQPLPLKYLLKNSLYYPASGNDGAIVKHLSKNIQSFVFCDYSISEDQLISQLNSFHGYSIVGNRAIGEEEYTPSGWKAKLPPNLHPSDYFISENNFKYKFAHWAVFERIKEKDANYGSKRFSLLYIGGEGITTYDALYCKNNTSAKALAIIQPGQGLMGYKKDFCAESGPLGWMILNNQYGTPDTIFYGGIGTNYDDLNWRNYQYEETIEPYYGGSKPHGKATVWKKK